MNRFGDIDVSCKRLPPIYGYRSEKLVSIEKALEFIQSEIDELPYYIKIAKKSCHYPSEHGLSKDQSAALYIYTMEWGDTALYRLLNKALRLENRQALKIWFPYLKLFDTALDKLPTVKEVVWRGVPLDIGKNFTKNHLITWWSINSCSSSVDVIKGFLGNDTNSTLFLIEVINGKKMSGYTEYENEDEIILRMGTEFRVKSNALEQSNGSHVVHLIEIDENNDNTIPPTMNEMHVTPKSSNQSTLKYEIDKSTNVEMDVILSEIFDSSTMDPCTSETSDNVINNEDMLKLIKNKILQILGLNENEMKYTIINDLLEHGRQSLTKYQENISPKIYNQQMNNNDSELIQLLKEYFELNWKIQYNLSNEWFTSFIEQYKNKGNPDQYEYVLTRIAKYGNRFMKNYPILSIILQLLFGGIDDECLIGTNKFDRLWFSVTNYGLKSIEKYSEYIAPNVLNEQMNKNQSILFKALCEYYRQDLFQLLKQNNITNTQNLYDLTLDNVAEHGWIDGVKIIQDEIPPKKFTTLFENLNHFLQQQNITSQMTGHTESIKTIIVKKR